MNKVGSSPSLSEEEEYEACETPLFMTATWEHREMKEGVKARYLPQDLIRKTGCFVLC